jgi:hypothetical protein
MTLLAQAVHVLRVPFARPEPTDASQSQSKTQRPLRPPAPGGDGSGRRDPLQDAGGRPAARGADRQRRAVDQRGPGGQRPRDALATVAVPLRDGGYRRRARDQPEERRRDDAEPPGEGRGVPRPGGVEGGADHLRRPARQAGGAAGRLDPSARLPGRPARPGARLFPRADERQLPRGLGRDPRPRRPEHPER